MAISCAAVRFFMVGHSACCDRPVCRLCGLDHNKASVNRRRSGSSEEAPNMSTQLPDHNDERARHSVPTGLLLYAVAAAALFACVAINPQAAKWISDSVGVVFANVQPDTPAAVLVAKQAAHQRLMACCDTW